MRERGLLDNALIIFTSDHGDMMGERDHRFSKYCLYDGSVRVPMVLSGNLIPAEKKGTVDSRPAELVDWIPTICDAAGIEFLLNALIIGFIRPCVKILQNH